MLLTPVRGCIYTLAPVVVSMRTRYSHLGLVVEKATSSVSDSTWWEQWSMATSLYSSQHVGQQSFHATATTLKLLTCSHDVCLLLLLLQQLHFLNAGNQACSKHKSLQSALQSDSIWVIPIRSKRCFFRSPGWCESESGWRIWLQRRCLEGPSQ